MVFNATLRNALRIQANVLNHRPHTLATPLCRAATMATANPSSYTTPHIYIPSNSSSDTAILNQKANSHRYPLPNQQQQYAPFRSHALVHFTSAEGKRLLKGAMDQGLGESFFKLMGNFSTQSSAMLSGVSSLAMVLNALEIDPKRRWKGNWRWYSDELLETCSTKEEVLLRGMSFDEFHCLARSHCHLDAMRASSRSYQDFLRDVQQATSSASSLMVVSYSRTHLGQRSQRGGHFSPIGGYNKQENKVLIMDVARGHYPSVWVDARVLYEAMRVREEDVLNKARGYFLLRAHDSTTNGGHPRVMDYPSLKCSGCSRQCSKSMSARAL
ncbi:Phytochelatin synthase-domain-containing protein [Syncephalastrum racemosum]|uniref:glutathione gamma-glutamylcysteinyltransferase n=1 Tax=Syncephalastrum racemosum TaxID=13706 RepID=A0A1X2H900_SYNRA|nr:Phytochelatin synthase-domain-containing protein [Syncephalastrum racemosum]